MTETLNRLERSARNAHNGMGTDAVDPLEMLALIKTARDYDALLKAVQAARPPFLYFDCDMDYTRCVHCGAAKPGDVAAVKHRHDCAGRSLAALVERLDR